MAPSREKKEEWKRQADMFLKSPPFKSKFASARSASSDTDSTGVLVTNENSGGGGRSHSLVATREKLLRATFAGFLDIFCDTFPITTRQKIRSDIVAALVKSHLVPSLFFSDEFSSIRSTFSAVILNAVGSVVGGGVSRVDPTTKMIRSGMPTPSHPLSSRYLLDFEEIAVLGEGGFGTVYKVKSRVDHCSYAIKKISLGKSCSGLSMKMMSEVQMLAVLSHENIVRYHCAWMELDQPDEWENRNITPVPGRERILDKDRGALRIIELSDSDTEDTEVNEEEEEEDQPITPVQTESLHSFMSSESTPIGPAVTPGGRFWNGDSATTTSECESDGSGNEHHKVVRRVRRSSQSERDERLRLRRLVDTDIQLNMLPVVYIQMELCTCTLEQEFTRRNREQHALGTQFVDGQFNRDLLCHLMSAIEYIHLKNLMHRDIKPANIFIKRRGETVRFLLGDFGLACVHEQSQWNTEGNDHGDSFVPGNRSNRISLSRSVGVGTSMYAAPEQLRSSNYGNAVDVYSAGLVIFESYNVWQTNMERVESFEALRTDRTVPQRFRKMWPDVMEDVMAMTEPAASNRPSASQLLQKYSADQNVLVCQLRKTIKAQEIEIRALRREVMRLKLQKR